ncbi:MAG: CCC motif membrane protein [Bacteroidota bacterium]
MEQRDLLTPNSNFNGQQPLPNATSALVLGIISIVGSFCYGIVGLVCGIIGLVLANKDRRLYMSAPELYSASSFSSSNGGRICSIIGIILSSLFVVILIIYLIVFGALISSYGLRN